MSKKICEYKLQRINDYNYIQSDIWEKILLDLSVDIFILNEGDFKKLFNMQNNNEYNYEKVPNVLFLDCAPHMLEDIMPKEMLDNYVSNLGSNFFCAYLYERL